jgi:DNA-binding Lrp family transcriptional regulator
MFERETEQQNIPQSILIIPESANLTESEIIARLRELNTNHIKAVRPFAQIRYEIGARLFQLRALRRGRTSGPSFTSYVNKKLREDTNLCPQTGWNYYRAYRRINKLFGKHPAHLDALLNTGVDVMDGDMLDEFVGADIDNKSPEQLVQWFSKLAASDYESDGEAPKTTTVNRKPKPKDLSPKDRIAKGVKPLVALYLKAPADVHLEKELDEIVRRVKDDVAAARSRDAEAKKEKARLQERLKLLKRGKAA